MDSRQLLDAQFNRAVEIVQGLPKTGPIQTGYEEKLNMYSLYKQATVGNVKPPRPGLLDMLGRAKWDAWTKVKDMDSYEAKWRYVDALLRALSKYSDKTVARDLIDELQSYQPQDPSLSYTLTRPISPGSESSGSTASEESSRLPPAFISQAPQLPDEVQHVDDTDDSSGGSETGSEVHELAPPLEPPNRPLSSISSRYRTPVTSAFAASPPPRRPSIPPMQPLPLYETQSAFGDAHSASITSSAYPSTASASQPGRLPAPTRDLNPQVHSALPHYRGQSLVPILRHDTGLRQSESRTTMPLEVVVENVQAHLAALTERLDSLEASINAQQQRSTVSMLSRSSSGRGSPTRNPPKQLEWDVDDMGLWSLVLRPLLAASQSFRRLLDFLLRNESQSPVLMIVRRLCLDISFMMALLTVLRMVWRKSQARRREIRAALGILWAALTGNNRNLINRAV